MTTFQNITDDQFRGAAAEFFRATQERNSLRPDQAVNGLKALTLMYFGHTNDLDERTIDSAVIILNLAAKRVFEVELAHIGIN